MSAGEVTREDAFRIVREYTVRDRSYRALPLGLEVARYIRWKRNEWGATAATLRDYEAILRNLAVHFGDLELKDFAPPLGTERLRECWDRFWPAETHTGRTRGKVRSVWVDFFEWAIRERGLYGNPARALSVPKKRDVVIETFSPSVVERIIGAQPYPADWCGTLLILKYGLRRGGLGNVQRKHLDFERELLTVYTKGGRIYPVPIVEDEFWLKLRLLEVEAQWSEDDYLLYRQDTRQMYTGNGFERVTRRFHDRKPTGKLVHIWWYRCLERADLVEKGVQAGMNMHRGRHTAITEVLRSTHNLKLAQALAGHKEISSTSRYAQLDTGDLESALRSMREDEA